MLGMYVAADDGPYILASATDDEAGAPQIANADLVLYAGVGKKKRGSAAGGDLGTTLLGPRVFDGVFTYKAMVDAPTYAPTVDVAGLKVASATFVPVADAHIDRGDPDGTFGRDALLEVQGGGRRESRALAVRPGGALRADGTSAEPGPTRDSEIALLRGHAVDVRGVRRRDPERRD